MLISANLEKLAALAAVWGMDFIVSGLCAPRVACRAASIEGKFTVSLAAGLLGFCLSWLVNSNVLLVHRTRQVWCDAATPSNCLQIYGFGNVGRGN